MTRRRNFWLAGMAVLLLGVVVAMLLPCSVPALTEASPTGRLPHISPDYAALILPPDIAPLNFAIQENGQAFRVRIGAENGGYIEWAGRSPYIDIPLQAWRELLRANAGRQLRFEVFTLDEQGKWHAYEPIVNTIATEPIGGYVTYRLLDPVFHCWGHISIQQRDLSSFDEWPIATNRAVSYDCFNCHSMSSGPSGARVMQLRSEKQGACMLLERDGEMVKVNTATEFNRSASSYLSWHPNGKLLAFAAIKVTQFFHATGEPRDVFDEASDLGLYMLDSSMVTTTPAIARPDRLETYPAWSPDGRWLYFCSAPTLPVERFREVLYDLQRIAYDPQTGVWGEPETLISAADLHGSVTHPRVSPDGRFVMFCVCDYGNFSIYHPESDLYLMDLQNRQYHKMELNSNRADSYHVWSDNGRWVLFSSKRRDGLFTHLYLSHIDETGAASKPFILPQKDPAFYDSYLKVFNVPELADRRVEPVPGALGHAVTAADRRQPVTLDPQVTLRSPASQPEAAWRSGR